MGLLNDWDDLVHGTAVFGAALPFGLVFLIGWRMERRLWLSVFAALAVSFLWIFGWPSWPLKGSDDIVMAGLIAATSLVALGTVWSGSIFLTTVLRTIVWTGLCWLIFPAWLADEGGIARRLLIVGGFGLSISGWAALSEYFGGEKMGEVDGVRLTPAACIPPTIALSVLLQFGGATRFAQSSEALASALGGVCLLLILRRSSIGLRHVAALWGMMSALIAWAGWLFAEIQVGLALALPLGPLAALAVRRIPLPRGNAFLEQLWDGLAAAVVAGIVIGVSWVDFRKGGDSLGY
jgi:hypothetical protein